MAGVRDSGVRMTRLIYPTVDLAGHPITVNLQGAADIMHVHPKTVEEAIKSGELAAAKVGRRYVMMTRDVVALVERRIVQQTAERLRAPSGS